MAPPNKKVLIHNGLPRLYFGREEYLQCYIRHQQLHPWSLRSNDGLIECSKILRKEGQRLLEVVDNIQKFKQAAFGQDIRGKKHAGESSSRRRAPYNLSFDERDLALRIEVAQNNMQYVDTRILEIGKVLRARNLDPKIHTEYDDAKAKIRDEVYGVDCIVYCDEDDGYEQCRYCLDYSSKVDRFIGEDQNNLETMQPDEEVNEQVNEAVNAAVNDDVDEEVNEENR